MKPRKEECRREHSNEKWLSGLLLYVLVAAMFVLIAARFLQRIVYLMKKGEDET